jgi:hypothetical protein
MAISFDESNDYYVITDSTGMTLQDGDWCVGIWVRVTDNSGTQFQYNISNGTVGGTNTFNMFLVEDSQGGGNEGTWNVRVDPGTGTEANIRTAVIGADSTWWLLICQRDDSADEIQLWSCKYAATATKEATASDTTWASTVDGGDWHLGRRLDGDADRYYGGELGEFFKGDFALTQAEIESLANGKNIFGIGKSPDCYLSMAAADGTLPDLSGNGNSAARQDTPVTVAHPINLYRMRQLRMR